MPAIAEWKCAALPSVVWPDDRPAAWPGSSARGRAWNAGQPHNV